MITLKRALSSWIPAHEAMLIRQALSEGKEITLRHAMIRYPRITLDNMHGTESHTWDLTKVKI